MSWINDSDNKWQWQCEAVNESGAYAYLHQVNGGNFQWGVIRAAADSDFKICAALKEVPLTTIKIFKATACRN